MRTQAVTVPALASVLTSGVTWDRPPDVSDHGDPAHARVEGFGKNLKLTARAWHRAGGSCVNGGPAHCRRVRAGVQWQGGPGG